MARTFEFIPPNGRIIKINEHTYLIIPNSLITRHPNVNPARMGEGRGVYRVLVGRPEGKRPLERPRRRWKDIIKMDLREKGTDGANWIQLAQDKFSGGLL
jgi:hypothetical protein